MSGTLKSRQATIIIIPARSVRPRPGPHKEGPARRQPRALGVLLSLLALLALLHYVAATHEAHPTALPTSCAGLLRITDYARLVHLKAPPQQIGAIQLSDRLIGGQAAALVEVTSAATRPALDVYVIGCSMQRLTPTLRTRFSQHGLRAGTAIISQANTLITGELDDTLTPQKLALAQPLQQNVYREYRWQRGRFVEISFPGLYPVSSRTEAEALQQLADRGQAQPWSDPLASAEQLARDVFRWTARSSQDAVESNTGSLARVVLVQDSSQTRVTVTLQRLLQKDAHGLWFVTGARSSGITLARPAAADSITSPASLRGAGALFAGQTTATLFTHSLTSLSLLNNPNLAVAPDGAFAGVLSYKISLPQQPGLLLIQSQPGPGSGAAGQLLLQRVIIA